MTFRARVIIITLVSISLACGGIGMPALSQTPEPEIQATVLPEVSTTPSPVAFAESTRQTAQVVSATFPPTISQTSEASASPAVGMSISATPEAGPSMWKPSIGDTIQWQFSGGVIDLLVNADIFVLDMFDTDPAIIKELHKLNRKVVCYINIGSWENWRPDAGNFPKEVLGKDYVGWEGEKWLDIRQISIIEPLMRNRLDQCKTRGFDGVEPDNIDGYTNDTGFPLTAKDQVLYNSWFAGEAHKLGLSIGLKNDPGQAISLEPYFDWAITEDCFEQGWCEQMSPFIQAGKPAFSIEYTDTGITLKQFCPQAKKMQFSAILKNRELDAWREGCP